MLLCCPPGHGCNSPDGGEACALELCREAAADERDAALAVKRWGALQQARERGRGESERRFRRRAFERARDRALIVLAMRAPAPHNAGKPPDSRAGWRRRRIQTLPRPVPQ